METLLLPSVNNQLPPAAETGQPPGDLPEQGGFLRVLAGRLGGRTDGNGAPEDQAAKNPDSTLMAALLAAFAECGPTGFSPETGTPSEPGAFAPDGEPSSIPHALPAVSDLLLAGQGEGTKNAQIQGEKLASLPLPGPPASGLGSPGQGQGGVTPQQTFIPEVKAQAEKGNGAPEFIPEKAPSNPFSPPHVRGTSKVDGEMNQKVIHNLDPAAETKNAPAFSKVQDAASGKGHSGKENAGQPPTPEAPAGAKTPVREEARIPPTLSRTPDSSNLAREFPTPAQEEKEGLIFPGARQGQVPPGGKENQMLPGLYRTFAGSPASSLGGAEYLAGGKEAATAMRMESPGIYPQVGERVLWLIRNQGERIRISLDPPELGHLFLEIHRTKENIHTTLYTDNPATKATLEAGQREIQRIIESEGFKMERFDVLVQQDLSRFQQRKDSLFHSDPRSSFVSGNAEASLSSEPDSSSPIPRRIHSGSRYLDLFV